MKVSPFLSVIVPVYNEEERLFHLKEISEFLKGKKYSSELIVIDDGSTDKTLEKLKLIARETEIKICTYPVNRGKGWAIKTGMKAAEGEYRLFMDVDLSTPLKEIDRLVPLLEKNEVVIGTRKNRQAKVIVHQPTIRENLGKGFTWLSQQILGVNVSDFTCGFKCFSQKASGDIFNKMQVKRWGFDSEILFLAKKAGYEIVELPVTWMNDQRSKVRFPQDIINSLSELLTIIVNDRIKKIY